MKVFIQPLNKGIRTLTFSLGDSKISIPGKIRFTLGWRFYIKEIKLRYLASETSRAGIAKECIKLVLGDLSSNPISTLLFFFALRSFEVTGIRDEWLKIDKLSETQTIWISRQAALGHIIPNSLDASIDYDFVRNNHNCSFRVWSTSKSPSNLAIRELLSSSDVEKLQLPAPNDFKKGNLFLEVLRDARIYHGTYVALNSQAIPLDFDQASQAGSWPSERPFIFQNVAYFLCTSHSKEISEAIFVGHSNSWYHFIIDYLPRYLKIPESSRKIPVILPQNVESNILQILKIAGFTSFIFAGISELILIAKLIIVRDFRSPNNLDLTSRNDEIRALQVFFSRLPMAKSREKCLNYFFLLRPRFLFRKINNIDLLLLMLKDIGISTISPEKMSFEAQLDLFRHARIIIAESGAALTSLIFCNPEAILIEIQDERMFLDPFWKTYCEILGIRHTKIPSRRGFSFTGNPSLNVDLDELKTLILKKIDRYGT